MADLELYHKFVVHLGECRANRFVETLRSRARLTFWMHDAWEGFAKAHPDAQTDVDAIQDAFRICTRHELPLEMGTATVHHGRVGLNAVDKRARDADFPNARSFIGVCHDDFTADEMGVQFCPACRAAEASWLARNDE